MNPFSFDSFNVKNTPRNDYAGNYNERSSLLKNDEGRKEFVLPDTEKELAKKSETKVSQTDKSDSDAKQILSNEGGKLNVDSDSAEGSGRQYLAGDLSIKEIRPDSKSLYIIEGESVKVDEETVNDPFLKVQKTLKGLDDKIGGNEEGYLGQITSQSNEGSKHPLKMNVPDSTWVLQGEAEPIKQSKHSESALTIMEGTKDALLKNTSIYVTPQNSVVQTLLSDENTDSLEDYENLQYGKSYVTIKSLNQIVGIGSAVIVQNPKVEGQNDNKEPQQIILKEIGKQEAGKVIPTLNDKQMVNQAKNAHSMGTPYVKVESEDPGKNEITSKYIANNKQSSELLRNQKIQLASKAEYEAQYSLSATGAKASSEAAGVSKLDSGSPLQTLNQEIYGIQKDFQIMKEFKQTHLSNVKEDVKTFVQDLPAKGGDGDKQAVLDQGLKLSKQGVSLLKTSFENATSNQNTSFSSHVLGNSHQQQMASTFQGGDNLSKERQKKELDEIKRLDKANLANSGESGSKGVSSQALVKSQAVQLQSEVIPAIIQQIEKFQKLGSKNWTQLSLNLSDGKKVNVNIKVSGNKVSLRLDGRDTDLASVFNMHLRDIKALATSKGIDFEYIGDSIEYRKESSVLSHLA